MIRIQFIAILLLSSVWCTAEKWISRLSHEPQLLYSDANKELVVQERADQKILEFNTSIDTALLASETELVIDLDASWNNYEVTINQENVNGPVQIIITQTNPDGSQRTKRIPFALSNFGAPPSLTLFRKDYPYSETLQLESEFENIGTMYASKKDGNASIMAIFDQHFKIKSEEAENIHDMIPKIRNNGVSGTIGRYDEETGRMEVHRFLATKDKLEQKTATFRILRPSENNFTAQIEPEEMMQTPNHTKYVYKILAGDILVFYTQEMLAVRRVLDWDGLLMDIPNVEAAFSIISNHPNARFSGIGGSFQ